MTNDAGNKVQTIRLQKWIAELGLASRREAEQWIRQGRFRIGSDTATIGQSVDPTKDQIFLDGKQLARKPPPRVYLMLNKPDKVLTSREDGTGRPCIYDLLDVKKFRFLIPPVGRLDFRTEGLLLLTNDGDLSEALCHPRSKVPRHYDVLVSERLTRAKEETMRKGVELEDGPVKRTRLTFVSTMKHHGKDCAHYQVTVYEGRNRIVRRLFVHFGVEVTRLVRYGMGELSLPLDLKPGTCRALTSEEIQTLRRGIRPWSAPPPEAETTRGAKPPMQKRTSPRPPRRDPRRPPPGASRGDREPKKNTTAGPRDRVPQKGQARPAAERVPAKKASPTRGPAAPGRDKPKTKPSAKKTTR